jgi:transposase
MSHSTRKIPELTIGLDVGDKNSYFAVIDYVEDFVEEGEVRTTKKGLREVFERFPGARVVLETGTHSAWISELLEDLGHEVIVANARKVVAIYKSRKKTDKVDAKIMARLGRFDVELLWPTRVRGARDRKALTILKARDELVKSRTQQVNHIRSQVKSWGGRITGRTAKTFGKIKAAELPKEVRPALMPLVKMINKATSEICAYDRKIEKLCADHYPETKQLMQVQGVGPITALAFVLVVGDPRRFKKGRSVGSYVGLVPRQDESGESKPELPITKHGDGFLRRLLVGSSQYILGPYGTPCDLRQFGLDLAARGQKNAKRKAVVAVARKLTVLLHHLWLTGDKYDPWYNESRKPRKKRGRGIMKAASEPTAATN